MDKSRRTFLKGAVLVPAALYLPASVAGDVLTTPYETEVLAGVDLYKFTANRFHNYRIAHDMDVPLGGAFSLLEPSIPEGELKLLYAMRDKGTVGILDFSDEEKLLKLRFRVKRVESWSFRGDLRAVLVDFDAMGDWISDDGVGLVRLFEDYIVTPEGKLVKWQRPQAEDPRRGEEKAKIV